MRDLVKQFLDGDISRRHFLSGLGALGFSSVSAGVMARSLAAFQPPVGQPDGEGQASWMRQMRGSGGALLIAQLKAAGVDHIFVNPSTGAAPIFEALVDEPGMHLMMGLQEGALAAMADGYAKASGKTPFVLIARPGLPNAMTQMYNSWKDQIPVVLALDDTPVNSLGHDGGEAVERRGEMAEPITKWHWLVETAQRIPEVTRRAFKFASTSPCGPVFLSIPVDLLFQEAETAIMDQEKFAVPMKIRPDPALVERAARLLIEARRPLLYVGDEITWCGAQKEVLELAELLALPVSRYGTPIPMGWSRPFPTRNALFLGDYLPQMRYPGAIDVMLNLGGRLPYTDSPDAQSASKISLDTKLIDIRLDPVNLARVYPTELAVVADLKLATADLLTAVRSIATEARIKSIREERLARTRNFTSELREFRQSIAQERWDQSPISVERLALELENRLEKDTCFIAEVDSGRGAMDYLMSFGGDDKQYFSTTGLALGWGLPAAFGVKLALPDRPVCAALGDGAFLFSGPQPLWSFARYRVPVIVIVVNNQSYNNERRRILGMGGKQFQTGRDMICYIGDPEMDFAKMASALGVEAEVVREPSALGPAVERAKRATIEGRPYLLDVHVGRDGLGAASTWHPPYSVAALRKRMV